MSKSFRRPRRGAAVLVAALGLSGLAASPALAGTVSYAAGTTGQQLRFQGGGGEYNDVRFSWRYGDAAHPILIQDLSNRVTIATGADCVRAKHYDENDDYVDDPTTALCSATGITELGALLGDAEDTVELSSGLPALAQNRLDGGAGDDSVDDFTASRSVITGGTGHDDLAGYDGTDSISGNAGNDTISGGIGNDNVLGGTGEDTINLGFSTYNARESNTADGEDGDDTINGSGGLDTLKGGNGDDTLSGYAGVDSLDGGADDDTLDGDDSAGDGRPLPDTLVGGTGTDAVDYSERFYHAVNVSLDGVANDGQSGENDKVAADVENVWGGFKGDVVTGNGAANRLIGGSGDDVLNAGAASDVLEGGGGADQLGGGTGDDSIDGSSDADTLDGGDGDDDVYGGGGDDHVFGGDGADSLRAEEGFDDVEGGPGLDSIDAGDGNDRVRTRDDVEDAVSCSSGSDLAYADVADVLDFTCESIARAAGSAVDRSGNGIHFTAGPGAGNSMTVSLANNVLTFRDTAATIAAGTTCTSVNANTVTCPATGVNALYLDGADGNDVFNQTAAIATRFVGGTGNDSFRGGPLSDSYYGNDGDDIVTAAATMDGADLFAGGDGSDSMVYSARTTRVAITLDGLRNDGQDADGDGSGEEGDYVRADVERVTGGAGNDVLRGSDVGNVLRGGPGADTLSGGIGRDQHYGEAGTDTIVSRDGNADTATCGTEADTVVADATGVDVVAADCETVSRD